jgi:hypothetical protein
MLQKTNIKEEERKQKKGERKMTQGRAKGGEGFFFGKSKIIDKRSGK